MQISAKFITKKKETALTDQLVTLLADLKHPQQIRNFLNEFMTETERSVFAKRLAIIWELSQGKSYEQIKEELKVSSATISSVASLKDKPTMKEPLRKIKIDKKLEGLLGRFF